MSFVSGEEVCVTRDWGGLPVGTIGRIAGDVWGGFLPMMRIDTGTEKVEVPLRFLAKVDAPRNPSDDNADAVRELKALLAAHPERLHRATADFERMHRAKPDDAGIRQVYLTFQVEFNVRYPIDHLIPEEIEPPHEAWQDQFHPFWKTDPYTRWQLRYAELVTIYGETDACHRIHENGGLTSPEDDPPFL